MGLFKRFVLNLSAAPCCVVIMTSNTTKMPQSIGFVDDLLVSTPINLFERNNKKTSTDLSTTIVFPKNKMEFQ